MANITTSFPFEKEYNRTCYDSNCTTKDTVAISLDAALKVRYVYAAVGALGMIGNAIVAVVIMSSSRMRRATTNVLITNQSAIDFLASFFIIMCTFIRDISRIESFIGRETFCRLWADNLPMWSMFVSSTYNLVCITMERYSGIVYPMRHSRTCSRFRSRFAIAFAWFIGPTYNLSYMAVSSPYKNGECTAYSDWPSPEIQRAVGLLTITLQFFLPILIIAFAYIRIVVILRRGVTTKGSSKNSNPQDARRDKRMKRARTNVIKTLVMVAMSFVLCWSPNQFFFLVYNIGVELDFNGTFYHFTVIAVFLNSCINPFIYAFQYDQFKNELLNRCHKPAEVTEFSVTSENSVRTSDVEVSRGSRKSVYTVEQDCETGQ
ncbi:hypothetical protein LSH36_1070g00029 [Paralvinella palmiformis]|uniref:G-protein coupled receptors family 1 profile domain-containing protein n=1 Tax=Paralvinella palmiformis TaxID=53620 RepID=A0AAD9IWZ4_9ANNE|nr:hypothetical protein LSH36_1070g00029 [Paralvinella palmiformis]